MPHQHLFDLLPVAVIEPRLLDIGNQLSIELFESVKVQIQKLCNDKFLQVIGEGKNKFQIIHDGIRLLINYIITTPTACIPYVTILIILSLFYIMYISC